MTSYSTLKEAYNVDSFSTIARKKTRKGIEEQTADVTEPFLNDYSPQDDCYYKKEYGVDTKVCRGGSASVSRFTNPTPQGAQQQIARKSEMNPSYVETSKLSMNSTEVHGYKSHQMNTQGNSCSPLQAANYQYPISGECKKEFDKVMQTYTSDTTVNNIPYEGSENKNIQPYYDEDLEQYFDFNNFNDAIDYKSSNTNKGGYANDNTTEYRNMKTSTSKTDDNLLRTEPYNLSEEDKKQALQALGVLKSIEEKIKGNSSNASKGNAEGTASNGSTENTKPDATATKPEEKSTNTFYKNLINIALFIFIGVVFILLCDQIAELAIQIGMRRAAMILEPYLQKQSLSNIEGSSASI
jgi:hypothetical protein